MDKDLHIKLSEEAHEMIEDNANEYYGGNKTQFLRVATRDHSRTLAGKEEVMLKSLRTEIKSLKTEIGELQDQIDKMGIRNSPVQYTQRPPEEGPRDNQPSLESTKRNAQKLLLNSEEPLTLGQISDKVDAEAILAQQAVKELIDDEYIKTVDSGGWKKFEILME